ncbi:MAG: hypothetical protein WA761_08035 [Thermoplasmata archaeon]
MTDLPSQATISIARMVTFPTLITPRCSWRAPGEIQRIRVVPRTLSTWESRERPRIRQVPFSRARACDEAVAFERRVDP